MTNTKIQGFDGLDTRFDGLVIDKSTKPLTICQTNKYQTRYGGYMPYRVYGYRGYRGIKVYYLYRRIPAISHTETLSVSNNKTADRGGYIKRYQTILLEHIKHIKHMRNMRIYGLMV